jgi:hypothetical protein
MEPYQIDNLIEILRMVLGIGGAAIGASIVIATWFKARGSLGARDTKKLLESNESLHQAIDQLRADNAEFRHELHERVEEISGRVEFAERMLAKGGPER